MRLLRAVSAKLHYTDTDYGHVVQYHQRTSSQQFYNLLYNKFTIPTDKNLPHRNARAQHHDMLRCWNVANFCPLVEFVVQQVVELLWARPLVVLYNMSVAGVRVVEFGTNVYRSQNEFSLVRIVLGFTASTHCSVQYLHRGRCAMHLTAVVTTPCFIKNQAPKLLAVTLWNLNRF